MVEITCIILFLVLGLIAGSIILLFILPQSKNESALWVSLFFVVLLVTLAGKVLSYGNSYEHNQNLIRIQGGEITRLVCHETGCSALLTQENGTATWVWYADKTLPAEKGVE